MPLRIRGIEAADNKGTFYVVLLLLELMEPRTPFSDLDCATNLIAEVEDMVDMFARVRPYLIEELGFRDGWREQMRLAARI